MTTINNLTRILAAESSTARRECVNFTRDDKTKIIAYSVKIESLVSEATDLNEGDKPYKQLIANEFNAAIELLQTIYATALQAARKAECDKQSFYSNMLSDLESFKIHVKGD